MTDPRKRVHVAIGESATGSLMHAFEQLRFEEMVLCLPDDLAMGPIAGTPDARARWLVEEAGWEIESTECMDAFWQRLRTPEATIVVWMSRRYSTEYCGLLEVLWRLEDNPVNVVDVADIELHWRDGRAMPSMSTAFAMVTETEIVAKNLIERDAPVPPEARATYRAEWERLRNENAELRVATPGGVISAPISYFDDTILSCVTQDWQTFGRVVGGALSNASSGHFRQISNDLFFFERLLRLVENDVVESRRDEELWSYRTSWVRLTPGK